MQIKRLASVLLAFASFGLPAMVEAATCSAASYYLDPAGVCAGNTPCYTTYASMIAAVNAHCGNGVTYVGDQTMIAYAGTAETPALGVAFCPGTSAGNYMVLKNAVGYSPTFTISGTGPNNCPYTKMSGITLANSTSDAWTGLNPSNGIQASGNTLTPTSGYGMFFYGHALNITGNYITNVSQAAIFQTDDSSTVPGNDTFSNNLAVSSTSRNGGDGIVCGETAAYGTATCSGNVVIGFGFHGCLGWDNGTATSGISTNNIGIACNYGNLVNSGQTGVVSTGEIMIANQKNFNQDNNACFASIANGTSYAATSGQGEFTLALPSAGCPDLVRSSIAAATGTNYPFVRVQLGGGVYSASDYNNFWSFAGTPIWQNLTNSTNYLTLASWQAACSCDLHSISVNPRFLGNAPYLAGLSTSAPVCPYCSTVAGMQYFVRQVMMPTNLALKGAGFGGSDIGAVPILKFDAFGGMGGADSSAF